MQNRRTLFLAVAGLVAASTFVAPAFVTSAWAHAFLDHATPGVGSTVQGSPAQLSLSFTQNIVASFSGVSVTSAEGAAVPTGKAVVDPSDPATLHVSIGKLKPGTYVVNWHVVSVDTHHTSGAYKFTVSP
jgi:methionine-rich copper-binding protein CopC